MKPLDRRLLAWSRPAAVPLAVVAATGLGGVVATIAQAVAIAVVLAGAVVGPTDHRAAALAVLAGAVATRAALAGVRERSAHLAAVRVTTALRARLVERLVTADPGPAGDERRGELATTATRGVDTLEPWVAGYLPQVLLAAVAPPLVVLAIAAADPLSALIVLATLPLVPLFGALVGMATRERTRQQYADLGRLSAHIADLLGGLASLKLARRSRVQAEILAGAADRYRRTTLSVLRTAFLSSLVLELVATIATAVVAVSVGLRVLGGELALAPALVALQLAPEAYLPLRTLAARFHASAEGLAAADRVAALLETPVTPAVDPGTRQAPPPPGEVVRVEAATVCRPGSARPSLDGVDLAVRPGERVAVVGPTGAGKSTLVALVVGLLAPDGGRVLRSVPVPPDGTAPDRPVTLGSWREHVAWLPQHPALVAGTLAANVRLTCPGATDAAVDAALRAAGLGELLDALPDGAATPVGEGAPELSAGQRRRLALARVLARRAALVVLDEPTAHLDAATERGVLDALDGLDASTAVLVVTHRPAVAAWADRVVALDAGRLVPSAPAGERTPEAAAS